MGKGDRKSRKGKITMGSFGKRRPRKSNQTSFLGEQIKPNINKEPLEATTAKATKPVSKKKSVATKKTTKKAATSKKA